MEVIANRSTDTGFLTVEAIADLPNLPKLTLVAGRNGLGNIVKTVSVYEVPDAYKWMRGHEFVITTFLSVPSHSYPEVFKELARRRIAGLVLAYPELYYGGVPRPLIELADEYSLPLFTVTKDVAYIDIMLPILSETLGHESSKLHFRLKTMHEYNRLLLNGALFSDFTAMMHRFLAHPVLLLDKDFEPVAFQAGTDAEARTVVSFLQSDLVEFVHKNYRSPDPKKRIGYSKRLNSRLVAYPVRSGSTLLGLLLMFCDRNLDEEASIVVEEGLDALAILFIRHYADIQHQMNLKSEFFDLLMRERLGKDEMETLNYKARLLGISPVGRLRMLLIEAPIGDPGHGEICTRPKYNDAYLTVKRVFPSSICFVRARWFVVLLSCSSDAVFRDDLHKLAGELDRKLGDAKLLVSPAIEGLSGVRTAYAITEKVAQLPVGTAIAGDRVLWAEQLEPLVYLRDVVNVVAGSPLVEWSQRLLAPVLSYDREKRLGLLGTMRTLLAEDKDMALAAKELCLHKNTLMYRKRLIKQLLGENPFGQRRFHYALALHVLSLQN